MKKFKFKINESVYEVSVNEVDSNVAEIEVNGTPFIVEIEKQDKIGTSANRKPAGKVTPIATPIRLVVAEPIKSPLPGVIVKVLVSPGQAVKRGDVVLTMESMKMENNILAEEDSVVKTILVSPGQSVMQDDVLVDFVGVELEATPAASAPQSAKIDETPTSLSPSPASKGALVTVKSPLPGSVFKVLVSVGQAVKPGDSLLVLESMKMENNILAEKPGVVKTIHVTPGQTVMQDDALIDLE
jgi:biotin carboxyl carrier protein